jgi:hypothetical protein
MDRTCVGKKFAKPTPAVRFGYWVASTDDQMPEQRSAKFSADITIGNETMAKIWSNSSIGIPWH